MLHGVYRRVTGTLDLNQGLLQHPHLQDGLRRMALAYSLIGTLIFAVIATRLAPHMLRIADGRAIKHAITDSFPSNLEIHVVNGTLKTSPPDQTYRINIPRVVFDLCGGWVNDISSDPGSLGSSDFRIWNFLRNVLQISVPADSYARITEFNVGENVEARIDKDLIACGVPRPLMPIPLGGAWMPATIEQFHPSSIQSELQYSIRIDMSADGAASECIAASLDSNSASLSTSTRCAVVGQLICRVTADALRRQENIALFSAEYSNFNLSQLKDEKAVLFFGKTRFAILAGYSYSNGWHWNSSGSYKSSQADEVITSHTEAGGTQLGSQAGNGSQVSNQADVGSTSHTETGASQVGRQVANGSLASSQTGARYISHVDSDGSQSGSKEMGNRPQEGIDAEDDSTPQLDISGSHSSSEFGNQSQAFRDKDGTTEVGEPRLWHAYTMDELQSYPPLSCSISLFCRVQVAGPDVFCSADVAKARVDDFLRTFPGIAALLHANLHLITFFIVLWAACVAVTVCCRILVGLLLCTPLAYIACFLFRHVEIPRVPLSIVVGIVMRTGPPLLCTKRVLSVVRDGWGPPGCLHPTLRAVLEWEKDSTPFILFAWAAWNGLLVIRMRDHQARQDRPHRISDQQQRHLQSQQPGLHQHKEATEEGHALAASPKNVPAAHVGDDDGELRSNQVPDGSLTEVLSAEHGVRANDDNGEPSNKHTSVTSPVDVPPAEYLRIAGDDGVAASLVDASTSERAAHTGNDNNEPGNDKSCRICLGGDESGKLISPCLCTGTMRFVHLECLNRWRIKSRSTDSFYKCDQCQYKYSFNMPVSSYVLRSVIVLYMITLATGVCLVTIFSVTAFSIQKMERYLFPIDMDKYTKDLDTDQGQVLVQQLANDSGVTPETVRLGLVDIANETIDRVKTEHVVQGLKMFSGLYLFPSFRNQKINLLLIAVGTCWTLYLIFNFVNSSMARLLFSAEREVLEVEPGTHG